MATDPLSSSISTNTVILELGHKIFRAGYAGDFRPRCTAPAPPISARTFSGYLSALTPALSNLLLQGLLAGTAPGGGLRAIVLDRGLGEDPRFRRAVVWALLDGLGGVPSDRGRALVGSVCFLPSIVAALYSMPRASGRTKQEEEDDVSRKFTTGTVALVVDWGAADVRVACVYHDGGEDYGWDGRDVTPAHVIDGTYQVCPMGFESILRNLRQYLPASSPNGDTWSRSDTFEIFQTITRTMITNGTLHPSCKDVVDNFAEKKEEEPSTSYPVTLPSSGHLSFPVLPDPVLDSLALIFDANDPDSPPYALLECLLSCPIDMRKRAASNILVVGGGAEALRGAGVDVIAGLRCATERGVSEGRKFARLKVCVEGMVIRDPVGKERELGAWLGASVAACAEEIGTGGWITRASFLPREED